MSSNGWVLVWRREGGVGAVGGGEGGRRQKGWREGWQKRGLEETGVMEWVGLEWQNGEGKWQNSGWRQKRGGQVDVKQGRVTWQHLIGPLLTAVRGRGER